MAKKRTEPTPAKPTDPPRVELSKLYFGKDDAESDISRGGLLKQGFMRTKAYDEALAGTKPLVIGRKGSGKSAICLMLRNALSSENRCSLVTPDEISAEEIRRFHLPGIPQEQSKKLIWRYVFSIQVAKYILTAGKTAGDAERHAAGELNAIRRFLLDNGEVDELTFSERFWRIIERLKGSLSVEAFGVKIGAGVDIKAPSAGTRASDQLDLLETRLRSAAQKLVLTDESQSFHVLVDQVEKVWSNDRESDSMVVGLLLAAKEVRERFEFVKCTVFLRTDIYEQLSFQDRDKFRGDEFHIEWDESRLQELILARAQASLGFADPPDEFWAQIFPEAIEEKPCESFLVGHTLMRPRDIIQLCNACRDTARTNGHDSILELDVKQALSLYSNWKLSDLQNEWSVNYPFLPDMFILLANSSYMVKRTTFESSLELVREDLRSRYPNLSQGLSADGILSILYSIGLLGAVRNGRASYIYNDRTERRIHPYDREFVIHPCFRIALKSTSAINVSPFQTATERQNSVLISRFQREARIGHFERVRGSAPQRILYYTQSGLEASRAALEKTSLPEDLREELRSNFRAMEAGLREGLEGDAPMLLTDAAERIHRHLSQIHRNLRDKGWLEQDKDFSYGLEEIINELERYFYRGTPSEFAT